MLHAKGYDAVGTLEAQTDSGAKLRCLTLSLVERAKPAKTSYVRQLAWNASLLALLPAAVATAINEDAERAVSSATAASKSLREFDPKARAKLRKEANTLEVVEGNRPTMIIMYAEAWGDFNDDGIDDVAVAVINGATQGTYSYVRLFTLSRFGPSEPLRVIASQ